MMLIWHIGGVIRRLQGQRRLHCSVEWPGVVVYTLGKAWGRHVAGGHGHGDTNTNGGRNGEREGTNEQHTKARTLGRPQNMHATVKLLCMHIAIQSTSAMTILVLVLISNVAYILVLATKVTLL